jgi:Uma2 family endonuclease
MVHPALQLTYEDYLNFPPGHPRIEILEGEMHMVPAPSTVHQHVLLNLVWALRDFVIANDLGEVFVAPCDVVLSPTNVVQPDLFFISSARSHIITEQNIQDAPDLVVEIVSPSSEAIDRQTKRRVYARHGVGEYWIVDPAAQTIEVLTPGETGYQTAGTYSVGEELHSPILPGLAIPPASIFQGW